MANLGIIVPIPKERERNTVGGSLATKGFSRFPGAKVSLTPRKEIGGAYRTGLDPEALYLNNLPQEEKDVEIKRIKETKDRLEKRTRLNLDPTSPYYNIANNQEGVDKVSRVTLDETGAVFNLEDPLQEITWNWVKVHPFIAPSLEAYNRGGYNHCQYYVRDEEGELRKEYAKQKEVDTAIFEYAKLTPSQKRKMNRMMGFFVDSETTEEKMYMDMVGLLRQSKFSAGEYVNQKSVEVFNRLLKLTPEVSNIKDLVKQALQYGVWYERKGEIFQGENRIAGSVEDAEAMLLNKANQDKLLGLKEQLKVRQIDEE